jgi:cytochrome c peroxidase
VIVVRTGAASGQSKQEGLWHHQLPVRALQYPANTAMSALALFTRAGLGALVFFCTASAALAVTTASLADLGRALFFDANLSANRTQSCATCHDPARAFIDARPNAVGAAASLGADGSALGDRNAPSIAYAALVPPLTRDGQGHYVGGLFHDGHADDLATQAGQPMLNALEMQMPDAPAVVARIQENPVYVADFTRHFGAQLFDDTQAAFAAIGAALAAFERTPFFVAFDSRYDRFKRGELELTADEEQGRKLFFSTLMNCTSCHLQDSSNIRPHDSFSNFRYFNIGLPANLALRASNGLGAQHIDRGLGDNPLVNDPREAGKFRVPTLRNIALTAPYMHNGVFKDLRTAIFFYNKHLVNNANNAINPETGQPWGPPEVAANIDHELLRQGQPLDDERIGLIIAFLRTLTDQRLEPLLKK